MHWEYQLFLFVSGGSLGYLVGLWVNRRKNCDDCKADQYLEQIQAYDKLWKQCCEAKPQPFAEPRDAGKGIKI